MTPSAQRATASIHAQRRFDVVVCDIDGCLSPEGNGAIDLDLVSKIAAYNRRAIEIGACPPLSLCSGRPQPFGEAMCKLLGIVGVPCVFENGAWLYRLDTNEYSLDPAITSQHLQAVGELSRWVRDEFGAATPDRSGVTQQPGKLASVSLYHPDTAYLRTLMPKLAAKCKSTGWPIRVSMTWLYINLDLAHVSKGSGLDRISRLTQIPKDRTAGIGDTMSDLPIRERCEFFACPANAQEELKRVADYVSPFAEAAGVVDILQRIERVRA